MAQSLSTFFYFILIFVPCLSWDSDDLELFDLIEEINENFYQVFGIDQSAPSSDVRKSYRRLSLQYHPDKNDAKNAEEKFRQIVAIYEVLKDDKKRQRYNQVLVEGLPDWRQTVYYYRRARKMGIYELGIVLSIIITIGQYFVAWAVYVERRLVVEEVISSKKKKKEKKKKQAVTDDGVTEEEQIKSIPTPHFLDLWPFRLSMFLFASVCGIPKALRQWREMRETRMEIEEEEEEEETEEFIRKPKKRALTQLPEYSSEMVAKFSTFTGDRKEDKVSDLDYKDDNASKGEWSDEELVLLSKAVNKFPGGCHQRWEKIADMVERPVNQVIAKAKETKGNYAMHLSMSVQNSNFSSKMQTEAGLFSDDIITQNSADINDSPSCGVSDDSSIVKRHKPTKINKTSEKTLLISKVASSNTSKIPVLAEPKDNLTTSRSAGEVWTQNQQTILEWALKQYPKGTDKRWDLIAQQIPGKSKEDCVARFKELAELVNKRKKAEPHQGTPS